MAQNSFHKFSQLTCLHPVSQEQQEKIGRLEKEQEDARSDIKVIDNFTAKCVEHGVFLVSVCVLFPGPSEPGHSWRGGTGASEETG